MSQWMIDYSNGLRRFYSSKVNRILFVLIVLSITIASLSYKVALKITTDSLIEQMLHREQISTRAASKSIVAFIDLMGVQINSFSTRPGIVNPGVKTQDILDSFVNLYSNYPIGGIAIADENGKVIYNSNIEGVRNVGANIGDREYFKELKNDSSKDYVVSDPVISRFGASSGKYSTIIASPIIKNQKFNGILFMSVILPNLTKDYLEPLKISNNSVISLIDLDGNTYYSSTDKPLDIDISNLDYINNNEWKNVTKDGMLVSTSLVTFMHKDVWFLSLATPAKDATDFLNPFIIMFGFFLVWSVLLVLAYSIFLVTALRIRKRNDTKYAQQQ